MWIIPPKGAEGVLIAMGGDEAGYVLYVKDNKLVYHFNYYSYYNYTVTSTADVPTGKVTTQNGLQIRRRWPRAKAAPRHCLLTERRRAKAASKRPSPASSGSTSRTSAWTSRPRSAKTYKPPFKFTGTIEKVTIDLKK